MALFIAVAGNIGAGKTSLAQKIAQTWNFDVHFESVEDNPYLSDFYKDMKRWSFPIQVHFLSKRFEAHQKILQAGRSAIQDRTIYEDSAIFARALYEQGDMSARDYDNYRKLNLIMSEFLRPPDLLVYLRKSVPALKKNIAKRNRSYEKEIPESYLSSLNKYYDDWVGNYAWGSVLTLETDNRDFISNSEDYHWILKQLELALPSSPHPEQVSLLH